jgi:transcriptional regulator with XRE-family HTH domain
MPITITQADRKAVGANLRRHRLAANLTQQGLAERTCLSCSTISRLENAKTWPGTVTAMILAAVLRISLDTLLEGTFWTAERRRNS